MRPAARNVLSSSCFFLRHQRSGQTARLPKIPRAERMIHPTGCSFFGVAAGAVSSPLGFPFGLGLSVFPVVLAGTRATAGASAFSCFAWLVPFRSAGVLLMLALERPGPAHASIGAINRTAKARAGKARFFVMDSLLPVVAEFGLAKRAPATQTLLPPVPPEWRQGAGNSSAWHLALGKAAGGSKEQLA